MGEESYHLRNKTAILKRKVFKYVEFGRNKEAGNLNGSQLIRIYMTGIHKTRTEIPQTLNLRLVFIRSIKIPNTIPNDCFEHFEMVLKSGKYILWLR